MKSSLSTPTSLSTPASPASRWLLMSLAVAVSWTGVFSSTTLGQFRLFRPSQEEQPVSYELTESSGPWLIMCASFDGRDGQQDAQRLADELRTQYKLKTYVYHRTVDLQESVIDKGLGFSEPTNGGRENVPQRAMRLYNGEEVRQEYAVLVGDYAAIDSAKAQRTLAGLKELKPQSLNHHKEGIEDSSLSGSRMRAQSDAMFGAKRSSDWTAMNNQALASDRPLRFAFLLANPKLPEEYFAKNRVDKYLIKINTGLPHSLLKNKGLYTVKVASFAGKTFIKGSEIDKLKNTKPTSTLMKCEMKASILASYLRKQGYDAYEFHDRYESYVCVGSFDWVTKKENGEVVAFNPDVEAVVKRFQGRSAGHGRAVGFTLPIQLIEAGITCDTKPVSVVVPKVEAKRAGIGRFFR